jgi:hypothetical protein
MLSCHASQSHPQFIDLAIIDFSEAVMKRVRLDLDQQSLAAWRLQLASPENDAEGP